MQPATPYDASDPRDIERLAKQLVGTDLRTFLSRRAQGVSEGVHRGSFGLLVEQLVFGLEQSSESGPDFPDAGVELKTTPLVRRARGGLRVKERLVLQMIDYMTVVEQEDFPESTLWAKCALILLIYYLWERDVDPLDYRVELAQLWRPPEEDLAVIAEDWRRIVQKVREGCAHELSGSDTNYLEAATKASDARARRPQPNSDIPAKPRAFAFKASYMTSLFERGFLTRAEGLGEREGEAGLTLEQKVERRLQPFVGNTESELKRRFGLEYSPRSKHRYFLLAKAMLGVKKKAIAEFEKADVAVKTVRLQENGKQREHMSFRQIRFKEIVQELSWEEAAWREELERPFLFLVFQEEGREQVFKGGAFWRMPAEDLDVLEDLWEDTRDKIDAGEYECFLGARQHPIGHVRPKGRDSNDLMQTPQGTLEKKKCFWLNKEYVLERLKELDLA